MAENLQHRVTVLESSQTEEGPRRHGRCADLLEYRDRQAAADLGLVVVHLVGDAFAQIACSPLFPSVVKSERETT